MFLCAEALGQLKRTKSWILFQESTRAWLYQPQADYYPWFCQKLAANFWNHQYRQIRHSLACSGLRIGGLVSTTFNGVKWLVLCINRRTWNLKCRTSLGLSKELLEAWCPLAGRSLKHLMSGAYWSFRPAGGLRVGIDHCRNLRRMVFLRKRKEDWPCRGNNQLDSSLCWYTTRLYCPVKSSNWRWCWVLASHKSTCSPKWWHRFC